MSSLPCSCCIVPAGASRYRPAVVVGLPELAGAPRFGVVIVAPMTTDRGQQWADRSPGLYPRYPAGTANLKSSSMCLLDQVRALDVERVVVITEL